jgi:hypothetical protein
MSTRIAATMGRPEAEPARSNVVAAFPSVESARMAADALAAVPIPADKIALSPAERGLAGQWPGPYNYEERREANSSVTSGAIIGAVVGGVAALVLAGLISAMLNVDISALVLLCIMVFGAVGVGAIGGFMGASALDQVTSSSRLSQAWPRVSVTCEGDDEASAAVDVLRRTGPVELYRDEEQLV